MKYFILDFRKFRFQLNIFIESITFDNFFAISVVQKCFGTIWLIFHKPYKSYVLTLCPYSSALTSHGYDKSQFDF